MATVQLYSTDIQKKVNDILPLYGDSNFSDILNRLWMNGAKVDDLKKALLDDPGAGNTPNDVMAALLKQGIVTEQQLREAASSYVPPDAQHQPWPFHPEHTDAQGRVIPTFNDDATKFYPNAPRPQPVPTMPGTGGTPGTRPLSTVQGQPPPAAHKKPSTAAEVDAYEREHYANMLWVKEDPELRGLLETAAKNEYTPERFRAEFENSNWWKGKKDTVRKFIERQHTDGTTLNDEIDAKTKNILAMSSNLGLSFTYQDLVQMGTDAIKFGWDDLALKQNLMAKVNFDPNLGGGLGAYATAAKKTGKNYLINITDQEAFDWSKKLFTGEASEASIQESLKARAKSAYPSIADLIDAGTVPRDYFSQHINTAAQLLEVDPNSLDLTDPKYNQIVSYADDKGNIRPMTVAETTSFIKKKDEYWKTSNSAAEVTGVLGTLGAMFGKSAI